MLGSSIKTKHANDTVTSHLYLATAAASDSGKYTCAVGRLARAKLSLHILNGESVSVSQSVRPPLFPLRSVSDHLPVLVLSHFNFSSGEEPAAIQSSRAGKGGVGGRGLRLAVAIAIVVTFFFHVLGAHFEV